LLGVLAHPAVQQALMALLLGAAGSPQVAAGGQSVPTAEVLNLIGELVEEASAEAIALGGSPNGTPPYLAEAGIDPVSPRARAEATLGVLTESVSAAG
jgi:hypothetical protein